MSRLNQIMTLLGLEGCRNTYIGDEMTRGISGGQKRRVTLGEMLIPARDAKFMDCITNGTVMTYLSGRYMLALTCFQSYRFGLVHGFRYC
jgi:hypothetical protein